MKKTLTKVAAATALGAGVLYYSLIAPGELENNAEWIAVEVPSGVGAYELVQSYNPELSKREVRAIAKVMASPVYNEDSYIQGEFKLHAGATVFVPVVE